MCQGVLEEVAHRDTERVHVDLLAQSSARRHLEFQFARAWTLEFAHHHADDRQQIDGFFPKADACVGARQLKELFGEATEARQGPFDAFCRSLSRPFGNSRTRRCVCARAPAIGVRNSCALLAANSRSASNAVRSRSSSLSTDVAMEVSSDGSPLPRSGPNFRHL